MRKHFQQQSRFDCAPIASVPLNLECRDEIVPILYGLRHLYSLPEFRLKAVKLIEADLNELTRRDVGRPGLDDWQVLVLAVVRLGCNLDYDKLEDYVSNHRALRAIMGIGDWEASDGFSYRRIRDTLCQIKATTIVNVNELVVQAGHAIAPEAATSVRADSFVIETNIHHPSESSLLFDGVRKFVPLCVELASELKIEGWRQSMHLVKKIKKLKQDIGRVAASKSKDKAEVMRILYSDLITRVEQLIERADALIDSANANRRTQALTLKIITIQHWVELTERVNKTARRRVLDGETVPNEDKVFSLFEPHTQLYRRGKAGQPNQYGRLVLVYEDAAGFISHYHMMAREATDDGVVVEQTKIAQEKHNGCINTASFDRGFHSANNVVALSQVVSDVCLPPRAPTAYAEQMKNASVKFHNTRLRHSGIESAIGAMQRGNGLKRCRDRTEAGFERYFGLAVLGRNIHTLGKLLLARHHGQTAAAYSRRDAQAA